METFNVNEYYKIIISWSLKSHRHYYTMVQIDQIVLQETEIHRIQVYIEDASLSSYLFLATLLNLCTCVCVR